MPKTPPKPQYELISSSESEEEIKKSKKHKKDKKHKHKSKKRRIEVDDDSDSDHEDIGGAAGAPHEPEPTLAERKEYIAHRAMDPACRLKQQAGTNDCLRVMAATHERARRKDPAVTVDSMREVGERAAGGKRYQAEDIDDANAKVLEAFDLHTNVIPREKRRTHEFRKDIINEAKNKRSLFLTLDGGPTRHAVHMRSASPLGHHGKVELRDPYYPDEEVLVKYKNLKKGKIPAMPGLGKEPKLVNVMALHHERKLKAGGSARHQRRERD